jgi:hypothetical protein
MAPYHSWQKSGPLSLASEAWVWSLSTAPRLWAAPWRPRPPYASRPLACDPAASHPHPTLCTSRRDPAHFTETENSPGELSLSRIRKAPRWFRCIRISSASCREIRPEYHLWTEGLMMVAGARLSLCTPTPPVCYASIPLISQKS